jgi:hypothetical protein
MVFSENEYRQGIYTIWAQIVKTLTRINREMPKVPKLPKMPKVNVFYLFYENRNSR